MDIHVDIRRLLEIHAWICYGFSDQGEVIAVLFCSLETSGSTSGGRWGWRRVRVSFVDFVGSKVSDNFGGMRRGIPFVLDCTLVAKARSPRVDTKRYAFMGHRSHRATRFDMKKFQTTLPPRLTAKRFQTKMRNNKTLWHRHSTSSGEMPFARLFSSATSI